MEKYILYMSGNKQRPSKASSEFLTRRSILQSSAVGIAGSVMVAGCIEEAPENAGVRDNISTITGTSTATSERRAETETPTETETATEEGTVTEEETMTDEDDTGTAESDEESSGSEWYVKPDGNPSATPSELVCEEEGTEREEQQFQEGEQAWGDEGGPWELRVDRTSVERGGEMTIRLTNISDEKRYRGSHGHFNLQLNTSVGWQEVRVWDEDEGGYPQPDVLRHQGPGESYEWNLEVSEDGIPGKVCPGLPEGRYRFVYYGFESDGEGESTPLGVGFDVA